MSKAEGLHIGCQLSWRKLKSPIQSTTARSCAQHAELTRLSKEVYMGLCGTPFTRAWLVPSAEQWESLQTKAVQANPTQSASQEPWDPESITKRRGGGGGPNPSNHPLECRERQRRGSILQLGSQCLRPGSPCLTPTVLMQHQIITI